MHPRYFSLLAQRKVPKRNGTRRLALCCRKGFPALLALSGARELAIVDRSNMHALVSGNGCDARQRQRDWVQIVGYGVPRPPWCSRAPQGKTGRSEDCLSDRRSRVPQRRFWPRSTGQSERSGDQALGCLFFGLPFFRQVKKGNAGALSTALSKKIHGLAKAC